MKTKLTLVVAAVAVFTLSSLQSANAQSWVIGGNTLTKDTTLGVRSNFGFRLITNNSSRLTITASGDVGINTTTPTSRLEVTRNSGLSNIAKFTNLYTGIAGDRSSLIDIQNGNGVRWRYGVGGFGNTVGVTNGQFYLTTSTATSAFLAIATNGNVGIGIANPSSPFDIAGKNNWNVGSTEGDLRLGNSTYRMKIGVATAGAGAGDVRIRAAGGTNRIMLGGGAADVLTVVGTGRVGIGTITPQYQLSVNGTIQAKEVRVETGWSDYVFEKDYQLRSLNDVENFISANKHLPGIASAKDIQQNGLPVAEMQTKMMEKIEELTLYIIQLSKENKELQKQIDMLKK